MNTKLIKEKFFNLVTKRDPAFFLIWLYLLMVTFFSISNHYYFTIKNFQTIFSNLAVEGIVVIGVAFVILSGNFDLSVGSIVGLTSVLIIYLFKVNFPIYLVVICSLILGLFIGLLNGFITIVIGINSIISTLATSSIISGTAYLVSTKVKEEIIINESFSKISRTVYMGVLPSIFIFTAIGFIFAIFILKYTHFGRNVYCIGGNYEIARLSGIRTKKTQIVTYMLSGLLAALASVLLTSRTGSGRPELGQSITIEAVTICVLGGILITGGKGGLYGVFMALLFLNSITTGLVMLDVQIYLRYVISGLFLIFAIIFNQMRYRESLT